MIIHPSIPLFIVGLLALVLPAKRQRALQLAGPLFVLAMLIQIPFDHEGIIQSVKFFGYTSILIRFDSLSRLFVYTFLIFGFFAHLYSLHNEDRKIRFASNFYIASSVGAALAGDMITLFIFWEIMAVTSAILIFNKNRPGSAGALFRYLLFHLTGGLLFFSGLMLKLVSHDALQVKSIALDTSGWLMLIGFCINAGVVPLHAWLPDAYPEGTPSGSVYMSAYTTKVAVYVLARCFAGQEILIWLGAISAVYGVIFALMENDMRKLLSYHIICQVGYILCGFGLGSELGINAGAGHAVGNILFKGLLFMATGAIIYQTGRYKLSELGGFAAKSKIILIFYMIGAFAISGVPLLNGYVTKAMLFDAAGQAHLGWLELTLTLVAAGTFLSIPLKLAYFAFWAKPEQPYEIHAPLPVNMIMGMAGLSSLCLLIGVYPQFLYEFLPYHAHSHIFGLEHLIHTLELLAGTWLGFLIILPKLHIKAVLTLDVDWIYRKGSRLFIEGLCRPAGRIHETIQNALTGLLQKCSQTISSLPKQQIPAVSRPINMIMGAGFILALIILILQLKS
ncbi:MAG: Na(+)/H(+) antiporter subunit D [Candidatus Omnitrophica bacterium]|nr:Na(+)/H(+) antiporter subunit D [Candidatus Omnitrophota bacterium]